MNEKLIVMQFKPLFYDCLRSFKRENKNFNFVLSGAGSLELHAVNVDIVNTLDADVHIWDTGIKDIDNYYIKIQEYIRTYFTNAIKYNVLLHDFIEFNMKKETYSKYIEFKILPQALRLIIYGYDIADIKYSPHTVDEYKVINEHGVKEFNILSINSFIKNHFDILLQDKHVQIYKDKYKQKIRNIDKNKISNDFNMEVVHDIFDIKKRNANLETLIDIFIKSFIAKIINKNLIPRKKFEMNRIRKTLRRIAIIFYEIFNVMKEENDYKFKQNHTSCLVISLYNSGDNINYTKDDIKSCDNKALVGIRDISPPPMPGKCNNTVNDIVCRWTSNSSEITSNCLYRYYSILMGWNVSQNKNIDSFVDKLQQIIYSEQPIKKDIVVYKTVRHILYNKSKSAVNFEIGEIYYQPMFNSATYYQGTILDQFSNFETGISIYIINIPKGSNVYKLPRSKYPVEYEIILPIGCAFQITKIDEDAYIKNAEGVYLRMKAYYMKYINPSSPVIDWKLFKANVNPTKLHEPCNLKGEVITDMFNGAQQYQHWTTNFRTNCETFLKSTRIAISEKIKYLIEICSFENITSATKWFGKFCAKQFYSFFIWSIDLLGRSLISGIDYILKPGIDAILSGLKFIINKTMIKSNSDGKLSTSRSSSRNSRLSSSRSSSRNSKLSTSRSRNSKLSSPKSKNSKLSSPKNSRQVIKRKRTSDKPDNNLLILLNIIIDTILSEKLTISTRNALVEFKKKTTITENDIIKLNELFKLKNSEMEASLGLLELNKKSSSSLKQRPVKKLKIE